MGDVQLGPDLSRSVGVCSILAASLCLCLQTGRWCELTAKLHLTLKTFSSLPKLQWEPHWAGMVVALAKHSNWNSTDFAHTSGTDSFKHFPLIKLTLSLHPQTCKKTSKLSCSLTVVCIVQCNSRQNVAKRTGNCAKDNSNVLEVVLVFSFALTWFEAQAKCLNEQGSRAEFPFNPRICTLVCTW